MANWQRSWQRSRTSCGRDCWALGYTNEQLAKIYGGNKMRVYAQVWEGKSAAQFTAEHAERVRLRRQLQDGFHAR